MKCCARVATTLSVRKNKYCPTIGQDVSTVLAACDVSFVFEASLPFSIRAQVM